MPEDTRTTYVVLLRGVNVGGKNRLPMAEFSGLLTALGAADVRTFIQSGNAVFRAAELDAARAASVWADAIRVGLAERCGLDVPVVILTAAELRALADDDPFAGEGLPENALSIGFLSTLPSQDAVRALDPDRSPGDRFAVRGRAIHLVCPYGVAKTKLTNAWFDRQLGVVSTFRNLRTVAALVAMTED